MVINKTFLEKSQMYGRLKKRWARLPDNFIFEVMENSEVNEIILNKVRSIELNRRIKEYDRKKNTNG